MYIIFILITYLVPLIVNTLIGRYSSYFDDFKDNEEYLSFYVWMTVMPILNIVTMIRIVVCVLYKFIENFIYNESRRGVRKL